MSTSPKRAFQDLSETLGAKPPKEFNDLTAKELQTLDRLLSDSVDLHAASIATAEEDALQMAPRPLRGTIRRILGA